jgi:hypothetical protein
MVAKKLRGTRRAVSLMLFLSLIVGLMVVTSSALGKPGAGNNSANAKVCKDWPSLFREDGSTFVDRGACSSYAAEGGIILTSPPVPPLPNRVVVNSPSSAAGVYDASGAAFGPSPSTSGMSGSLVLVNDGTALSTEGCFPLVGFPAGAIAIVDRGSCDYTVKVANAQAAGAVAVVVINDIAGDPVTMGGSDPSVTIPAVMVAQDDGNTIKAGLPAAGSVIAGP